jgi:hypothetical protein
MGANMTFTDKVVAVCFIGLVILNVIPMYLPSTRGSIISLYDAGMFAVYLVVLSWWGDVLLAWDVDCYASISFGSDVSGHD